DRRPHSPLVAHESGLRDRGRQTDPRVASERGVVPGRGEPVLDAEGAGDQAGRAERCARGVRSRARGIQAADHRITRSLIARLKASHSSDRTWRPALAGPRRVRLKADATYDHEFGIAPAGYCSRSSTLPVTHALSSDAK